MKRLLFTTTLLLTISISYGQSDLNIIRVNINKFSAELMASDTVAVNDAYTADGKILPNGSPILEGESLRAYWNK